MRYIKSFQNSSDVQNALNNGELGKPYVAFNGTEIDWNGLTPVLPFNQQYFTFEILSAGTINWSHYNADQGIGLKTISYSLNNGVWTDIVPGTSISVDAGDIVRFKGTNDAYADFSTNNNFGTTTAEFNCYGNILSLIYGDNFTGQTTLPTGSSYNFANFFRGCLGIHSAENLILPENVTEYCYFLMFRNCSSLTGTPVLPAATLADNCYYSMFLYCDAVNYIKCLATVLGENSTLYWLDGVSPTGTFVKAASMNDWQSGVDGIPENWTVVDAQ